MLETSKPKDTSFCVDTSGLVTDMLQSAYLCYQETAKLGHEPPTNSGWVIEAFFAPKKMPV